MNTTVACMGNEEMYQRAAGRWVARELAPRTTPFGTSSPVLLIEGDAPFYLMSRTAPDRAKPPGARVNARANLYALRDLDVGYVLDWAPGGAITRNMAVGDLVILDDVIDQTHLRDRTFFETSGLGALRQFPVFCHVLRTTVARTLTDLRLLHHEAATAAISEGPRQETPAEIRMLAGFGAQVVTHNFVPEVFLAKELELCYAAVCYLVSYAETGSRHRPFAVGELFGGLSPQGDSERLQHALGLMMKINHHVADALASIPRTCDCTRTMDHHRRTHKLDADWRNWFVPDKTPGAACKPIANSQ